MQDNYGINKAALGIRYLLKYIETENQEYFNIVMDCLNEIELWCVITCYCNNIDELLHLIPEFVLDNIFTTKVPVGLTFEEAFGAGFKSNSNLSSKEQFIRIRGLLSHGKFRYEKRIITVFDSEYEASFDLKWLERLTSVTLGNERLGLSKGMSEIAIMTLVQQYNLTIEDFKECLNKGLIRLYKITALSSNKKSIVESMPSKVIAPDELTFEMIFQTAVAIIRKKEINIYDTPKGLENQLKKYYKELEEYFGNKIKVENMKVEISDDLLSDQGFISLSNHEKLAYLIRIAKLNDPVRYNGAMLQNLLELFKGFKEGYLKDLNVFALRDSKNFLSKVYANIFFAVVKSSGTDKLMREHSLDARYVYAQNIYKEYLKVLKRSYEELEKYNGSQFSKKYIYNCMREYSKLLEEVMTEDAFKNIAWKMRNSLIHNQVDFKGDFVRFYNTGRNIKLNHFSKKSKTWEFKEFSNKRIIWEMTCSIDELIALLDELFTKNGIEVQVNIAKYTRRKDYLRNL